MVLVLVLVLYLCFSPVVSQRINNSGHHPAGAQLPGDADQGEDGGQQQVVVPPHHGHTGHRSNIVLLQHLSTIHCINTFNIIIIKKMKRLALLVKKELYRFKYFDANI